VSALAKQLHWIFAKGAVNAMPFCRLVRVLIAVNAPTPKAPLGSTRFARQGGTAGIDLTASQSRENHVTRLLPACQHHRTRSCSR
jgi:hypothetical protein